MKGRPKLDAHIQMSVLVPCDLYRQLHMLRATRGACGDKLPPLGGLIREALSQYVATASGMTGGKAVR